MSNTKKAIDPATRRAAAAFLEGVIDLARELDLPRGLAITLLGRFALYVVNMEVEDGVERVDATVCTMQKFARGLGVESMVEGELADRLRAQVESRDHPQQ